MQIMAIEAGIAALIYNALKDVLGWVTNHFKRKDPANIIVERQKRKEEIEAKLNWIDNVVGYGRTIIRDIKRMDNYPNVDPNSKGISPWFRVSLLGTYHKGLQVGLLISGLKYDESHKAWRYADYKNNEVKDVNAILVGHIPYERIVSIDWNGDEYYSEPHFYCRFIGKKKEPYEELIFCEKRPFNERYYYRELANYYQVRKLSKKLNIESNR